MSSGSWYQMPLGLELGEGKGQAKVRWLQRIELSEPSPTQVHVFDRALPAREVRLDESKSLKASCKN